MGPQTGAMWRLTLEANPGGRVRRSTAAMSDLASGMSTTGVDLRGRGWATLCPRTHAPSLSHSVHFGSCVVRCASPERRATNGQLPHRRRSACGGPFPAPRDLHSYLKKASPGAKCRVRDLRHACLAPRGPQRVVCRGRHRRSLHGAFRCATRVKHDSTEHRGHLARAGLVPDMHKVPKRETKTR